MDLAVDTVSNCCQICFGSGWVCEEHPDKPMEHIKDRSPFYKLFLGDARCDGAGMPCKCNKANPPWEYHNPK